MACGWEGGNDPDARHLVLMTGSGAFGAHPRLVWSRRQWHWERGESVVP